MSDARSPLTLETDRLVLCLPGASDAAAMVRYYESNRSHLEPWEPPFPRGLFTVDFWERRLRQNRQEYRQGRSMRLVLFDKHRPRGPVLGMTNYTQFVRGAFMSCTLGYSIERTREGQGLMHEALTAGIDHLFANMGMHRIQANYMPINERSGRLLERLGFEVEGYGKSFIFINGAWRDHIMTARLNDRTMTPDYITSPPPTPRRR